MCRLLETIQCADGMLFNINYHQRRVNAAFAKHFAGCRPIDLSKICVPFEYSTGLYRVRVVYDRDLQGIEFFPAVARSFNSFILIADDSIEYSCKYEDRSALNKITERKGTADEAIIVKNGLVTDTTISNLLLFDGAHWFTPETPLLCGTMRQQLLDHRLCFERRISVADLSDYKSVLMINALLGFQPSNASPIHTIQNLGSFCNI